MLSSKRERIKANDLSNSRGYHHGTADDLNCSGLNFGRSRPVSSNSGPHEPSQLGGRIIVGAA